MLSLLLVIVAVALLSLTYLLNSSNYCIRAHTWHMIRMGMCVFLGISLYHGTWRLALHSLAGVVQDEPGILMRFLCVAALTCVSQLALLKAAKCSGPAVMGISRKAVACATLGSIVGQITGFAWVAAWEQVENLFIIRGKSFAVPIVILGALLVHVLLARAFERLRNTIAMWDGKLEEHEVKWQQECQSVDVECGAVILSFVTVEAILTHFHRDAANFSGLGLPSSATRTSADAALVAGLGIAAQLLSVTLALTLSPYIRRLEYRTNLLLEASIHQANSEDEGGPLQIHVPFWRSMIFRLMTKYSIFLLAWASLLAAQWLLQASVFQAFFTGKNSSVLHIRTLTAGAVTFFGFAVIVLLGHLEIRLYQSHRTVHAHAVENIIQAAGLTVGFSWERCFQSAQDLISSSTARVLSGRIAGPCESSCWRIFAMMNVGLSTLVALTLAPVLFHHIIPKVIREQRVLFSSLPEDITEILSGEEESDSS